MITVLFQHKYCTR